MNRAILYGLFVLWGVYFVVRHLFKTVIVLAVIGGIGYGIYAYSQKEIKYPNDFVTNSVDSKTIACLVKSESELKKYFSKKEQEEFAKKLSSLDVNKISQQTKDEVNYSVDKKYVDYLQRSVDDFAEELQR